MTTALPDLILEPLVRAALMEDLGTYGDVTTRSVIPEGTTYIAKLRARAEGVVSGMQIARLAFHLVDPSLAVRTLNNAGSPAPVRPRRGCGWWKNRRYCMAAGSIIVSPSQMRS